MKLESIRQLSLVCSDGREVRIVILDHKDLNIAANLNGRDDADSDDDGKISDDDDIIHPV